MKKIIIEVPEKYSNIMALTLVGGPAMINTTTGTYHSADGTHFIIPETGPWIQTQLINKEKEK